jgi:hypothetical protein
VKLKVSLEKLPHISNKIDNYIRIDNKILETDFLNTEESDR